MAQKQQYVTIFALSLGVAALTALFIFAFHPGKASYAVLAGSSDEDSFHEKIYKGQVIDAVSRRDVRVAEGWLYRTRITDYSRDTSAGVTRLGGMITFVPGAAPGEDVIVKVTAVKRSTANACVVKRLSTEPQPEPFAPTPRAVPHRQDPVQVGGVYTGTVTDIGSKGDGIVKVDGKVVFVDTAEQGAKVRFRVVENRDRFALGRVIREEP